MCSDAVSDISRDARGNELFIGHLRKHWKRHCTGLLPIFEWSFRRRPLDLESAEAPAAAHQRRAVLQLRGCLISEYAQSLPSIDMEWILTGTRVPD